MKYKYFWQSHSPFSNWYMSIFSIFHDTKFGIEKDEQVFCCVEQYMMFRKAMIFNDVEIGKQILALSNPKEIKSLGRKVKNFNPNIWNKYKYDIVKTAVKEKFSQNEKLKTVLLKYHGYEFVEASPYDNIWGIGFDEEDAPFHISEWGENLLGKILTEVCNELYDEN